ncbi:MAG: hypothetical protein ACREMY_20570 [bacterium]
MKALLLAVVLVLVPVSASAECAWVMWFFTPGVDWFPVGGWKGPDQCEQERLRRQSNNPPKGSYWVCFPDTVDPRESKGAK